MMVITTTTTLDITIRAEKGLTAPDHVPQPIQGPLVQSSAIPTPGSKVEASTQCDRLEHLLELKVPTLTIPTIRFCRGSHGHPHDWYMIQKKQCLRVAT